MMYWRRAERAELALASSVFQSLGSWQVGVAKNAALSVFLQCTNGMKPSSSEISRSRRSVIAISVGHIWAISPRSVVKVWVGRSSTKPPPLTPRMETHQRWSKNASVILVARAYAGFPQRNLEL